MTKFYAVHDIDSNEIIHLSDDKQSAVDFAELYKMVYKAATVTTECSE